MFLRGGDPCSDRNDLIKQAQSYSFAPLLLHDTFSNGSGEKIGFPLYRNLLGLVAAPLRVCTQQITAEALRFGRRSGGRRGESCRSVKN